MMTETSVSLPEIRLVIFDCDGVLIDSEGPSCRATASFARKHGITMSDEDAFRLFSGKAAPQIARELHEMAPSPLPEDTALQLKQGLVRLMQQGAEPVEGAVELIKALLGLNMPVAAGSNSSMAEMDAKFSHTGMDRLLPGHRIHSATDRGVPKPDPDIYLHIAKAEGIPPHNTLVIEDSDTGAEAAWRAGMACLLLRPEGEPLPGFWPVEYFLHITHLSQVLPLIRPFLHPEIRS